MPGEKPHFERVIWIVLDSVGIGELPDADDYGDVGRDTLGHIAPAAIRSGSPSRATIVNRGGPPPPPPPAPPPASRPP